MVIETITEAIACQLKPHLLQRMLVLHCYNSGRNDLKYGLSITFL